MRTIISLSIAIFLHLILFYFFFPKSEVPAYPPQAKFKTIDLTQFNFQQKAPRSLKTAHPATDEAQQTPSTIPSISSAHQAGDSGTSTTNGGASSALEGFGAKQATFSYFIEPEYPRIARMKGLQGKVKIKVTFNHDGIATSVEVLESSSHSILDEAVKKTALTWKAVNNPNSIFEKTFEFKLNN